jgi:hypothetical protein
MTTGDRESNAASSQCEPSRGRRLQRQAGLFRNNKQISRSINIISDLGVRQIIQQRGQLNLLKPSENLNALERRAARFPRACTSADQSDRELIDATMHNPNVPQTNKTIPLHDCTSEDQDITALVDKHCTLLTPLGITPSTKGEGITRILYENINGLQAKITGNEKLHKIMENVDDLEVDLSAFNEHKINFKHKESKCQGLGKLLDGGETRAIGGNISHPFANSLG